MILRRFHLLPLLCYCIWLNCYPRELLVSKITYKLDSYIGTTDILKNNFTLEMEGWGAENKGFPAMTLTHPPALCGTTAWASLSE